MPRGVINFLLSLSALSLHASRHQVATEWIAPCEMFHKMDSEEPLFSFWATFCLWKDVYPSTVHHTRVKPRLAQAPQELGKKYASLWNNQSWPCVYFTLQERHDDTHITWHGNGVSLMPWLPWGRLFTYQDSRKYWIGLVTNSILFCCSFKSKFQCKKVFWKTHNQGLRQLIATVFGDLSA